ncbi:MAG: InlB B-repeat-containing protein [Caldicoprobacterales bacterium]|jgi:uncharacterized repeat protein (TIGR02543 family)|nr:InlB B-repeat-containing protein [Clostridiales bacterium]
MVKDPIGKYSNIHTQNINILPVFFAVRFETNSGSNVPDQSIVYGGKVTMPPDPTRAGYYFAGWYKEPSLTNKWDFATDTVKGDTVLYAKWVGIISVDITWGSMEFTFTTNNGEWNPETHTYENTSSGSWTYNTDANKITITNHSNAGISVSLKYESKAGFSNITGTISNNSYTLPTAEGVLPANAPTGISYLTLSGIVGYGHGAQQTIGTVTVQIGD